MVSAKSTGNPRRKASSKAPSGADAIQLELRVIAVDLHGALSAVTVAAHALQRQNADMDADVASVLQRAAGAPLHVSIEKIEALLERQ